MSLNLSDLLGTALQSAMAGNQPQTQANSNPLGGIIGGLLGGNQGGNLLGSALGALTGGGNAGGNNGGALMALLPLAMQFLQSQGGVGGLVQKMQAAGHGDTVASWVGTGENAAIAPDAVAQVVGLDTIAAFAQKTGMSTEQISGGFAHILPELVNQLSPKGAVADNQNDMLNMGLSALGKLMG